MKHYQQLTIEEREAILAGLWRGQSLREIAQLIRRSPSTVSREISRNRPSVFRRYTPRLANARAKATARLRGKRHRLKDPLIQQYVIEGLRDDRSPEQIAGRLRTDHPGQTVSHEAIYQFIYAQYHRGGYGSCHGVDLRGLLPRAHRVRTRKYLPFPSDQGRIIGRISIDQRPAEVNERRHIGHWEGDSMVSRKSLVGLNTLVERVSGILLLSRITNSTARETARVVIRRLKQIPRTLRQTCTLDNGHENADHRQIANALKMTIYFAHPYHSWERGTNENTNGLVRRYLPKGTDFATVSDAEIARIEEKLNNRPRKRLGYQTPREVFNRRVALKGGM